MLHPSTIRILADLVEVDGRILSLLGPITEEQLRTVPGLAQALAQRSYLLEKLDKAAENLT